MSVKITNWDDTKPEYGPGALAFEVELAKGRLLYVIRRASGSLTFIDPFDRPLNLSNSEKMRIGNVIRAYMITHPSHFSRSSNLWPETDEEWCDYYKMLDLTYATTKDSPLHHDNRCPMHKEGALK